MIELEALNLHWMPKLPEEVDKCAHSSVFLRIGNRIVSDETSGDWTVSSSAYYLLKSLRGNHIAENEASQLLPCCGFNMWAVGDNNDELVLVGCPSGIDWTITHEENRVIHEFDGGEIIETDLMKWRQVVCDFSDRVSAFYQTSLPKVTDNNEDKIGFELFMKLWAGLRQEANRL